MTYSKYVQAEHSNVHQAFCSPCQLRPRAQRYLPSSLDGNLQIGRALFRHSQTRKRRAVRLVNAAKPFVYEEGDRVGAISRGDGFREIGCALRADQRVSGSTDVVGCWGIEPRAYLVPADFLVEPETQEDRAE